VRSLKHLLHLIQLIRRERGPIPTLLSTRATAARPPTALRGRGIAHATVELRVVVVVDIAAETDCVALK